MQGAGVPVSSLEELSPRTAPVLPVGMWVGYQLGGMSKLFFGKINVIVTLRAGPPLLNFMDFISYQNFACYETLPPSSGR